MKTRNKVMLLGSVGKDPEIKSTAGGTLVANFSLATNDRQKDAQGNWQDRVEWHNLVAFSGTAQIVKDYVKKGDLIDVEGRIQTRSWADKETGQKKYRTEIVVNDLILLGGNKEKRTNPAPTAQEMGFPNGPEVSDDDSDGVPF